MNAWFDKVLNRNPWVPGVIAVTMTLQLAYVIPHTGLWTYLLNFGGVWGVYWLGLWTEQARQLRRGVSQ
jgi:hypothetical protein